MFFSCAGHLSQEEAGDAKTLEDARKIWKRMMAVVLNLHLEPWRLLNETQPATSSPRGVRSYERRGIWRWGSPLRGKTFTVRDKYQFGSWSLMYNELETPTQDYEACEVDVQEEEASS